MVLEEKPAKVVEALRLFLQGNGYGMNSFIHNFCIFLHSIIVYVFRVIFQFCILGYIIMTQ